MLVKVYKMKDTDLFSYEGDQEFLVYCANQFIDTFNGKDTFLIPLSDDRKVYNTKQPNTAIYSSKQKLQYQLSRFLNDIYVTTDILKPELLRKMPSSFWAIFIELDTIGCLSFSSSTNNEKVQNKKNRQRSGCAIFELIKEIVLIDEYDNYCNDFGSLEVVFDLTKEQPNLIENIIKALTLLHKINYLMYRKSYLNSKK